MITAPSLIWACDICGCGTGSYYVGILPEFKKRFIGMRYQHKSMVTGLNAAGGRSYMTSDEQFHIAELWGAINLSSKFRLMGFVPYNINQRLNQGEITNKNGLGDIAVYGYYNIFDNRSVTSNKQLFVHSLWGGIAVKLPTGNYNHNDRNVIANVQNTFQLGTGSTDLMFNIMYDLRLQDAGLNTNISYKLNSANSDEYRFGNKFTANLLAYYKFSLGYQKNWAPNTGFMLEQSSKDVRDGKRVVEVSGGHALVYSVGSEWALGNISLGINYQIPVIQQLAQGKIRANNRLMVHVSCSF